jgi:DsbC/DsbD-like thiol-disulfide interchange protein
MNVKVLWPRPERMSVNGHTVNGYPADVVLPLLLTPEDPSEEMSLRVKVTFAVCRDVCVPVTSEHQLQLVAIEDEREAVQEARERAREAVERARERALEAAEAARERAQEIIEAARERALERAEEARERVEAARELALARAEAARDRADEERERALEAAEEARQRALQEAEEQRERAREAAEEARERALDEAEATREEAARRAEARAKALEEKAERLALAAEEHARVIEEQAKLLAELHGKAMAENADATVKAAEEPAKVLEENARKLAEAADKLAAAYAALIAHYVEMVPDGGQLEATIHAMMGEVAERGSRRALHIKVLCDRAVSDPQVFVEAGEKIVFGTVETKVGEDGRTLTIMAPISRAKGPIDGRWVTVTIVDGSLAIEKRLKIAPRNVVTLPWPVAPTTTADRPSASAPPIAALPD